MTTALRGAARGATLLEMMVVVAILGIVAALAAPQLLPMAKRARLSGDAEAVAAFLDAVRQRATADGRCYRVRAISATALVAEQRNSGDCVNIARDGWNASSLRVNAEPGVTYSIGAADVRTVPPAAANADHRIIFRPSGRLYGDGDIVSDDDRARVVIADSGLTQRKSVVVMSSGRVCIIHHNGAPAAITGPDSAQNDCNQAVQ